MHFLTNVGSEIVDELGEITVAGQTKFHPEIIANVLSLNETTKRYRVKFNSGDDYYFNVNIVEDNIVKFPDNYDGIYCSKSDKVFLESG